MDVRCPPSCFITPFSGTCERNTAKGLTWTGRMSHQLPSWAQQTLFGENLFNLLAIKSEKNNKRRKKEFLKTPFPHPSLLPMLNFTSNFLYLLTPKAGEPPKEAASHVVCANPPSPRGGVLCLPLLQSGSSARSHVLPVA